MTGRPRLGRVADAGHAATFFVSSFPGDLPESSAVEAL